MALKSISEEFWDQAAHFVAAMGALVFLVVYPSGASAAFAGFMLGLQREIGEQRPPLTFAKIKAVFKHQKIDLFFWSLGGLVVASMAGRPLI